MARPTPDTILGELAPLAVGLHRHDYAREAARVMRRAVSFDGAAVVWFDPATALPVDTWIDNSLAGGASSRLGEIELHEHDISAFRELAASGRRAARLSEATGGPGRHGFGDELRVVRVGDSGMWAAFVMHREPGAPTFTGRDVRLFESLTRVCEEMQRVTLERDLAADASDHDRGLLLLDDESGIEMADAAAAAWLDELRDDGRRLPVVVKSVADRAREIASGHSDVAAKALARTAAGRWVSVRGSVLRNGSHDRTAVTLEPARAPELAGLIADAHGLTGRERRVTQLVAQGLTTAAIAARLYLSTYTVQDHLKAIFEKLDVSSRGELVARLFVDHSLGRGEDPAAAAGGE